MSFIQKTPFRVCASWCIVPAWRTYALSMIGLALILASVVVSFPRSYQSKAAPAGASGDWPMYMHDVGRSGFDKAETIINRTSAPNLKVHWTIQSGGTIFSQPVVANGMVYWGSFDGYEHASDLNGNQLWQQYIGVAAQCAPFSPLGVVSTAAVATVPINGTNTSVVFVGGGDDHLYALDAATGATYWSTPIGNPSTNTFIWDSPLVFNNNVYIGSASTGEGVGCKNVQAQFFELNASTGVTENTFNPVPNGCVGGSIWGSPTFDGSGGSVYITTGNQSGSCKEPYVVGLVKLHGSNLVYQSSWQIPLYQRTITDADFGTTPTLFIATINGTTHQMVGAVHKNGLFYAFDRSALSNGPLWSTPIAAAGNCPECGQGSISPGVHDGSRLYIAGGTATINGVKCGGNVTALDPATGNVLWQTCLPKTVLGAITEVNGVIALIDGQHLTLLNTATGAKLFDFSAQFYGSPSISNGVIYAGTTAGKLYAFGL